MILTGSSMRKGCLVSDVDVILSDVHDAGVFGPPPGFEEWVREQVAQRKHPQDVPDPVGMTEVSIDEILGDLL
jgi:hypothetical protein